MTESSTPQAPELPKQRPSRKPSGGRGFLVFLFRLLLLGVSSSLAGLLGIAIAQFYPGTIEDPPLVEKLVQGTQSLRKAVIRLPQSWSNEPSPESGVPPVVSGANTSPSPEASPSPQPSPVELSAADRQEIQSQLAQLQSDLQQLNNRAATLETRVGGGNASAPIEERLRTIQQQLDPNAAPPSPTASSNDNQSFIAPATSTLSSDGELLMVTLPTDALFTDQRTDQQSFRAETSAILDSLIADLQRYPGATIRVVGHTDSRDASETDRARSFEQASAVANYLSAKLGDDYEWIVVGYGGSRPLAENTSEINRQRNRRIELVIDPAG